METKIICDKIELDAIADAIREKTGGTEEFTIGGMASAIGKIKTDVPVPLYAMLYEDGEMVFQLDNVADEGRALRKMYKLSNQDIYLNGDETPWSNDKDNIQKVSTREGVSIPRPISFFHGVTTLVNSNNFNIQDAKQLDQTYYACSRLAGPPACGNNVKSMYSTYYFCTNLRGAPVCGPNVTSMRDTYDSCINLRGAPVCGPNVTSMYDTYFSCTNLTGAPVCGPNVISMFSTYYNCINLTGAPVCGNNVTNMYDTYRNCYNLTGAPVCGNNVTDMDGTYRNCYNLTGAPVCGPNVISMRDTYYDCTKLTGAPVCGNNVTSMNSAYRNCYNLTGAPVCGNNVTDMAYAYHYCTNLTGSPVCGPNVTNIAYTYVGCPHLAGNAYFYSPSITNVRNCFRSRTSSFPRINIYVPANSTTNTRVHYTNSYSLVGTTVTWTTDTANNCSYNTNYNIYIYPVANVAAARTANGDD